MGPKMSLYACLLFIGLTVSNYAVGQELGVSGKAESVPDEILVKYKPDRSQSIDYLESKHKLKEIKYFDFIDVHHYKIDGSQKITILDQLNSDPSVEYAEPNYLVRALETPNDPLFSEQWGLTKINAPLAWDLIKTNGGFDDPEGVTVAVIDTGVDYNHPDFQAYFSHVWENWAEFRWGNNGKDDDGNGWVDDFYGIDAYNNDGDPMDDNGHGTHCAGIIAAVPNNGLGVAGVCWSPPQGGAGTGANIMALKFLPGSGEGATSGAIACIYYAIQNGAKVLSNSWGGGGYSQALYDAIAACRQNNILFIAAAGNGDQYGNPINTDIAPFYPSCYNLDNIISVAATDESDNKASWSNYGPTSVDLAAPGVHILSTVPGAGYQNKSGTSMATPFVSGAAALILSMQENEYMPYAWLKNAILYSVDPVSSLTGLILTSGRLNLAKALEYHLQIRLRYPNGGEYLSLGTPYTISWVQFGLSSYHVNIELWQGNLWVGFIARNLPANSATWTWDVGSLEQGSVGPGENYKIRIYTADTPIWMGNFEDTSADDFHLLSRISVISPNGGENWQLGTSQNIVWDQAGLMSNTVNIELYKDAQFLATIASNYTSASASYSWNVGDYAGGTAQPGSGYSILVESFADPDVRDISDGVFTIAPPVAPGISVTSPNGGEQWLIGSTRNITWTSTGASANVKVEYSTNSGSSYSLIAASTPNDGTHPWMIPNTASSTCLVKVSDAAVPSSFDVSNTVFLIVPVADKRISWTAGYSGSPAIAVEASGKLHVIWQDDTSGNHEIYYKKSTDKGATWATGKKLTSTSGYSGNPAIAVELSGKLHAVWQDDSTGNYEINYKKSPDGGATWTINKRLTWTSGASQNPDIAVDASGHIHAVWYDDIAGNQEIFYAKSIDNGATWTSGKRLSWNAGGSEAPGIEVDGSDNLHVIWRDDTPGNEEIFYAKSTDNGASWIAARRLTWTSGGSWSPDIFVDSSDNLNVVWYDNTSGNGEIYHKKSQDGGATWTANKRLTWNSANSYDPVIAVNSAGNIFVVFCDDTLGVSEIYYKNSTDGGVAWKAIKRLTWTLGASEVPSIGVDSSENLHIVLQDNTPGNYEIYYLRLK